MKISNFLLTSLALTSLLSISLNSEALTVGGKTVGQITEHTLTVDEKCSWNDSKSGEAIHAVEEGQVIIGYEKIGSSTWEGSGYDIDVTPARYNYSSYSKSIGDFENLINVEGSGRGEEYKGRLEQELNALQEAVSKLQTSHSTFAIDWRCKGSGNAFDQKRGKVYASYKVRVMSLPSPQAIETYLASGQSIVSTDTSENNSLTIVHSHNGRSHTDNYANYKTWGGDNWRTWILPDGQFKHQKEGSPSSHTDTIINYITWDGSEWTATIDPSRKVFRHTRKGSSSGHEDTILNYVTWDGTQWTMRLQ